MVLAIQVPSVWLGAVILQIVAGFPELGTVIVVKGLVACSCVQLLGDRQKFRNSIHTPKLAKLASDASCLEGGG